MPELPEVETVKRGLNKLIIGKSVAKVDNDWPKSFPNDKTSVDEFLIGAKVAKVRRRAKVLIIDLSSAYSLVVHLKMTGQLVFVPAEQTQGMGDSRWVTGQNDEYKDKKSTAPIPISQTPNPKDRWGAGHPNDSLISKLPDKSTRVEIAFSDGSKLFFNDQRKFGWMRLLPTIEVPDIDFMKKAGPEPLEPSFTEELFLNQINKRKNSNIKAALLDQTVIAGIGNIYADESLYAAKIHPLSRVGGVPKRRLLELRRAIIDVLNLSLEKGGSTDRNYINAEGKKGSYIEFALVFRREGQICQRCQGIITKTRAAGRGTHICKKCQKVYK